MSSVNLLTGLSTGRFDSLKVKNPVTGEYEAILPGTNANQLLKVYAGGVLYPASGLSFANAYSMFDPVTSTLQIGGPLYQGFVRIGDSVSYSDLTRGSNGELLWDGSAVASEALVTQVQTDLQINLDATVAYVQANFWPRSEQPLDVYVNGSLVSQASGLNFSNHSNSLDPNTGILTLGPVLSQTLLRLGTNAVYGDLTRGSGGELLWDGNQVSALAHYSETSGATTTLAQSFDTATPISTHMNWGGNATINNVSGSHQEITLNSSTYLVYGGQTIGERVYVSLELKAATPASLIELAFAVRNNTYWTDTITFQGLSSSVWRTFTWSFDVPDNATIILVIGQIPAQVGGGSFPNVTLQSGTVLLRNFHMYKSADLATISAPLTCEKDVTFSTSIESQHAYIINGITAANYFSSSDERLKTNVQDASLQSCQQVFDAVQVKTYERTDLAGKRIGFIAQDIEASSPSEFANLYGTRPSEDGVPYLTLDYSRLVTVLWGVVKNMQARLEALEANLP
jgi:hypothetical protein